MSWPGGSWPPAQPAYGGYSTAVPPQAPPAVPVGGYSSMPPDQYAQWQQWQQYQQQYAQWHAQYGEQYARQMGQPMAPNVAPPAAMPMPTAPAAMPMPTAPPAMPMPTAPIGGAPAYSAHPSSVAAAPPPPAEPHPDSVTAAKRARPAPLPYDDEQSQKTAEELAFDEQFRKWEEEFENWKSKNANHPDKTAYHEYEKKFIECRKKLLERREHLRNKRLADQAAAKANHPPPPPLPADSTSQGMGLFASAMGGSFGFGSGSGIPGLDLLNENRSDAGRRPPPTQVTEIIELDDDNDNDIKPDLNKVNERMSAASNPVSALASLLKDPKVSALLNIITNTTQSGAPSLPAGQSDILQKLQSAAGAVVNANGGLQSATAAPTRPPFQDDRSRTSFSDDRSRDYDSFNQASYQQPPQQQPVAQNSNYTAIPPAPAPPANYANNGYNYAGMPPAAAAPPSYPAGAAPPAAAVPLMSLDMSRPPPLQGSPAPSNASSTNSQNRSSRWGQDKPPNNAPPQQQQQPPFNGGDQQQKASRWGVKERPQPQQQQQQQQKNNGPPQNGGKPPMPTPMIDEKKLPTYYSGHLNELQVDPELGTPCAVPKPEWMTEEEYDEIFDRYENVAVFEERKYKMELAIRMLEQQKKKQGLLQNGVLVPANATQVKRDPYEEFFRPKQVIDYSNGAPQVIDYGHSSGTNKPDQRQGAPPRRLEYSHSQQHQQQLQLPGGFCVDRPPHYSEAATAKLAMMHFNPNPEESNPSYPCKFILMNDNRPNRPSTKRGKRASSIRKQKLREQQQGGQPQQQGPNQPPPQQQQQQQQQQQNQLPNQKGNIPEKPPRPPHRQIVPLDALLLPSMADMSPLNENEQPPFDMEPPAVVEPMAPPPEFDLHPAAMQDEPMTDYELEMKRGEPVTGSSAIGQCPIVPIEDLLMKPGRFQRPPKICFVMRGLPGSGKSYLARMIKDCEVKQGGPAPRVLSLDDYFLVDTEVREPDPKTGRPVLVTKSEYKFDGNMEDIYMQNLVKAFKRTIAEDVFHFIIVDCPNEHLKYYNEFYAVARSNGFKVFTVTLQTEIDLCIEQNIHNRTADEIRSYANNWALGPDDHPLINAGVLFDDVQLHPPADMELCTEDDDGFAANATAGGGAAEKNGGESAAPDGDAAAAAEGTAEKADDNAKPDGEEDSNVDVPELGMFTSKWDTDATEQNLARLDGISKPPRRPPTIEDFLQSDDQLDQYQSEPEQPGGKKRVRWADLEEAKAQRRMRDMGFVVGVTDWNRMMDPTAGGSALTKTKYIERVGRNNFRRN